MLQLVNISNYSSDTDMIHNSAPCLQAILNQHHLDGVEMMFCEPWDRQVHKAEWIQGVHLRFWPSWLDFWRGRKETLLQEFGTEEGIKACYGGLQREDWLQLYRANIRLAKQAGAKYVVFHVSHVSTPELFGWRFSATDREVVEAAVEVVRELAADIPADMALLFENLWWPGLTLHDKDLTARLVEGVMHPKAGIMLDTGHLMNTNPKLRNEQEGVEFILQTLDRLGSCSRYIKGIHLNCSLAGEYIQASQRQPKTGSASVTEIMNHVLNIDQHLPFTVPAVQRIVEAIQPDYLVHEFLNSSLNEWVQKIHCQQQALRLPLAKKDA